jgi:hypothetical protein
LSDVYTSDNQTNDELLLLDLEKNISRLLLF